MKPPAKVIIQISFDVATNHCTVNAPINDDEEKKLSMNILLVAMNIVNNYELKKVLVAQGVPS